MSSFFERPTAAGPGTVIFLNAGDPPLGEFVGLVLDMDRAGVDCLELAVPFPDSVTDGPVIRRSASRALDTGITLEQVLAFIDGIKPQLRRLKIVLLADWSHTVRQPGLANFLAAVAASSVDGLLIHALPPILRDEYRRSAALAGIPVVTTCYDVVSSQETLRDAAASASAYVYLVAKYGRSGSRPTEGYESLKDTVQDLRTYGAESIAVGFGVSTRADLDQLAATGTDAAIIGTAAVAAVEAGSAAGDVRAAFSAFLHNITPHQPLTEGISHVCSQA